MTSDSASDVDEYRPGDRVTVMCTARLLIGRKPNARVGETGTILIVKPRDGRPTSYEVEFNDGRTCRYDHDEVQK